jgi:hypothetical protein
MRDLPDVRVFPSGLIDDMHRAFDAVSSTLRLWQSDKATGFHRRSSRRARPTGRGHFAIGYPDSSAMVGARQADW